MAITSVAARGSGVIAGTGASSLALTPGTLMAAGQVLLVIVTGGSPATAFINSIQCATGSLNTFSKVGRFLNSANDTWTEIWYCKLRQSIAAAATYTIFFTTTEADVCAAGWEFGTTAGFGLHQSTTGVGNEVSATTGYGSAAFSGLPSLSRLYVRGLGKAANSTTTITATTNFTSWALALRSRNATAARTLRAEHRINTSTGETSNPTLAVSGNTASFFAALEEVGAATLTSPQAASITSSGCTPGVTVNQANGTLFLVVQPQGTATPTAAQVRNAQDGSGAAALVSGNGATVASGAHSFGAVTTLSPSTPYTCAFVFTNDGDIDSAVSTVNFTTLGGTDDSTITTLLKAPVQAATVVEKMPSTIATTLKAPVQAAAVVEKMPSTIATLLKAPVQAATARTFDNVTIATVLKAPVQSAAVVEKIPTTIATTLKAPVQSAAVVEKIPTTIATTLKAPVQAATASTFDNVTIATVLKAPVQAAAVVEKIPTTIATTLKAPVQSAAVVEKIPTTIATTLKAPVQSAVVVEKMPSTIATLLKAPVQAAAVTESIPTTIAMTLSGFAQSAAIVERIPDTIATTLFAPTQAATVVESIPTTIDTTLFAPTQSATDSVGNPTMAAAIDTTLFGISQEVLVNQFTHANADVATTLQPPTQAAAVTESIPTAITMTLFGPKQSAAVVERIPAAITTTLQAPVQSAAVVERIPGTIRTVLRGLQQAAVVAEVEPTRIGQTLRGITQSVTARSEINFIETVLFGFGQSAELIILPPPIDEHAQDERGRGGGSAPKEIPPHERELELFRAKEYRRNFDMAVPPVAIANVAMGSIASPPPRPVSVPLPPFVKPQ